MKKNIKKYLVLEKKHEIAAELEAAKEGGANLNYLLGWGSRRSAYNFPNGFRVSLIHFPEGFGPDLEDIIYETLTYDIVPPAAEEEETHPIIKRFRTWEDVEAYLFKVKRGIIS
jgi:hypothetical protein